jgi:hypothetical protein
VHSIHDHQASDVDRILGNEKNGVTTKRREWTRCRVACGIVDLHDGISRRVDVDESSRPGGRFIDIARENSQYKPLDEAIVEATYWMKPLFASSVRDALTFHPVHMGESVVHVRLS